MSCSSSINRRWSRSKFNTFRSDGWAGPRGVPGLVWFDYEESHINVSFKRNIAQVE